MLLELNNADTVHKVTLKRHKQSFGRIPDPEAICFLFSE